MVTKEIISKWKCESILITSDNQVYNQRGVKLKMQLKGSSKGYYINRRFRTLKWIKNNCILASVLIKQDILCPF